MIYKTRKDQMNAFARELIRDLGLGASVSRKRRQIVRDAMRDAAMCGAAEERYRTLRIVKDNATANAIIKQGVLAVLGYERP